MPFSIGSTAAQPLDFQQADKKLTAANAYKPQLNAWADQNGLPSGEFRNTAKYILKDCQLYNNATANLAKQNLSEQPPIPEGVVVVNLENNNLQSLHPEQFPASVKQVHVAGNDFSEAEIARLQELTEGDAGNGLTIFFAPAKPEEIDFNHNGIIWPMGMKPEALSGI